METIPSGPLGQDQSNTNCYSVTPHFLTESEIAALIGNGYEPVIVRGKACVADGWQQGPVTADRVKSERAAHPDARNIGIRTGAVVADDVDIPDPAEAEAMRRIGDKMLGASQLVRFGSKGSIAVYQNDTPVPKMAIKEAYTDQDGKHKVRTLVEMLGAGQQFVAFGQHPAGMPYRWRDQTPLDVPADFLLQATPDKIRACMMARFERLKANGHPQAYVTGIDVEGFAEHRQSQGKDELYERDYVEMLGHVEPDTDRDEWLRDLASQRGAPVVHDDGTPLSDDDLSRIAVRHSRGDLDYQGRYKAAPPASFSTSSGGQSLVGEESVEFNFWSLKPARPGQSNRTVASLIAKARKEGYAGFVTKLQRDLSKPHDPHSFDEVLKREQQREQANPPGTAADEADWPEPYDLFGERPLTAEPELEWDMVPKVIGEFTKDVAERLGVHPVMVAVPAVIVCAAAIDDAIVIQPRLKDTRWKESARLWGGPIADPGNRKSPAWREVVEPLHLIEARWREQDKLTQRIYEREHEEWETAWKVRHQQIKNGELFLKGDPLGRSQTEAATPPEPVKPASRQIIVSNVTLDRLAEILEQNHRGVLWYFDELAALLGSLNKYTKGGNDREMTLMLFDGGRLKHGRVKGDRDVPNWSACILGGIQPDKLLRLADDLQEDGFLQRMFLWEVAEVGLGIDREPNHAAINAYRDLVIRLANLFATQPVRVEWDGAAYLRKVEVLAQAMRLLPTTPAPLKGFLGKLPSMYARLLLTYHVIESVAAGEPVIPRVVSGDVADMAYRMLVRFILPHAVRVYQKYFRGSSGKADDARWLAGYLLARTADKVTAREIARANERFNDERVLLAAVSVLQDAGWLGEREDVPAKRSTLWPVNPRVHRMFAEVAKRERQRRQIERERIEEAVMRVRETVD